jgi:hypothetical protein
MTVSAQPISLWYYYFLRLFFWGGGTRVYIMFVVYHCIGHIIIFYIGGINSLRQGHAYCTVESTAL